MQKRELEVVHDVLVQCIVHEQSRKCFRFHPEVFQDIETGWSSREWLLSKLDIGRLKSCVSFSFQIQGIVGSGDLSSVIRFVDIYLMRCAYSYYTPSSLLLSMSSFTMLMPIPLRLEKL